MRLVNSVERTVPEYNERKWIRIAAVDANHIKDNCTCCNGNCQKVMINACETNSFFTFVSAPATKSTTHVVSHLGPMWPPTTLTRFLTREVLIDHKRV